MLPVVKGQKPAAALLLPEATPAFRSWTVTSEMELARLDARLTLTWMPLMVAPDGTDRPKPVILKVLVLPAEVVGPIPTLADPIVQLFVALPDVAFVLVVDVEVNWLTVTYEEFVKAWLACQAPIVPQLLQVKLPSVVTPPNTPYLADQFGALL